MMNTQIKESLKRAGGVAALATYFDISKVSIYEWIKVGRVPVDRCIAIEKLSGGKSRCEEMNSETDWEYLRGSSRRKREPATA